MKINITYSITTPESAEQGDYAEYGIIAETESLAEALDLLHSTRTNEVDGVRATSGHYSEHGKRLALAVFNGMEYRTGAEEQRGLHIHGISKASAERVARLANIHIDTF
jgi:hypothetical protein